MLMNISFSREKLESVRFQFRDIGPIAEAELELGDLTIIAGRNNTGKTYLVYALYGFLYMWKGWPGLVSSISEDGEFRPDSMAQYPIFDQITRQIMKKGNARVAANREALNQERNKIMEALTLSFSEDVLAGVFSSIPEKFSGSSFKVLLGTEFPGFVQPVKFKNEQGDLLSIEYDGENITATVIPSEKRQEPVYDIWSRHIYIYHQFLFPELSQIKPFVLSAERFGISLFYKELDFTKNRLVDLLQKIGDSKNRDNYLSFSLMNDVMREVVGRYALPVKNNIDYTRDIPYLVKKKSELYDEKLFKYIRNSMRGYYKNTDGNIEFRSTARGDRRFNIPLHHASSSARGLSDLYFFLRHDAQQNHLVVIDEPESHLDTANQVYLARLLARMVRSGMKVLVTTHSDYLIKEINNLVMLSSPFENKAEIIGKFRYKDDDCLAPDAIRAYVAKDSCLRRCVVNEFGIDMPTFDETIDQINAVANELAIHVACDQERRDL